VSGFLAFREGTALINAIKKLKTLPTVILVDGHGIAHPRGFGIASWIGYLLKVPTIGCAKNKLIGEYKMPKIEKGEWSPLVFNKKIIGAVLRTREKVKPIFISPGNLIDLETSITLVLSVSKYRIPEPLRIANMEAKRLCGS
jgi:deoxyribonuclease V